MGVAKTPEGTGTGNKLFPEWSVGETGDGNWDHGSVWSPCEAVKG